MTSSMVWVLAGDKSRARWQRVATVVAGLHAGERMAAPRAFMRRSVPEATRQLLRERCMQRLASARQTQRRLCAAAVRLAGAAEATGGAVEVDADRDEEEEEEERGNALERDVGGPMALFGLGVVPPAAVCGRPWFVSHAAECQLADGAGAEPAVSPPRPNERRASLSGLSTVRTIADLVAEEYNVLRSAEPSLPPLPGTGMGHCVENGDMSPASRTASCATTADALGMHCLPADAAATDDTAGDAVSDWDWHWLAWTVSELEMEQTRWSEEQAEDDLRFEEASVLASVQAFEQPASAAWMRCPACQQCMLGDGVPCGVACSCGLVCGTGMPGAGVAWYCERMDECVLSHAVECSAEPVVFPMAWLADGSCQLGLGCETCGMRTVIL
jgi:hypothetical protein